MTDTAVTPLVEGEWTSIGAAPAMIAAYAGSGCRSACSGGVRRIYDPLHCRARGDYSDRRALGERPHGRLDRMRASMSVAENIEAAHAVLQSHRRGRDAQDRRRSGPLGNPRDRSGERDGSAARSASPGWAS
jgi:hypothetical protein